MGDISYAGSAAGLDANDLRGFPRRLAEPAFAGETHLGLLNGGDHGVLALDRESGAAVGFVTAICDGVLSAYVSLLEVLPSYRDRGIGTESMRRMLEKLDGPCVVSLTCKPELQPFDQRLGMRPSGGVVLRNHDQQPVPRRRLSVREKAATTSQQAGAERG